jgi:fructose-specific phosphotransferase system IIC component
MRIVEQIQQSIPPQVKAPLDVIAIIGWISALAGAMTPIVGFLAAVASLAWGLIRLYETKTVQRWLKR